MEIPLFNKPPYDVYLVSSLLQYNILVTPLNGNSLVSRYILKFCFVCFAYYLDIVDNEYIASQIGQLLNVCI